MSKKRFLSKPKILITTGPTREPIDPVRFISNPSSGEMGLQVAQALIQRKIIPIVICGPLAVYPKVPFKIEKIETALQMKKKVDQYLGKVSAFVSVAAVSDYRMKKVVRQKIKKTRQELTLKLVKNPDILKEASLWKKKLDRRKPLLIGFALETGQIEKLSAKKMHDKNLDLIIGNRPSSFSNDKIKPYWLEKSKPGFWLPQMNKKKFANYIAHWLAQKI